jgi:hypothetical protein
MWRIIKKAIRPGTALTLSLALFLAGFPSSYLVEKITEHNIIDSLYWAGKDSNVVDKGISGLLKPEVEKAQAATFQMKTGYYVGSGADNLAITGVGFQPQLVLIKDNTANGADGMVFKTSAMSGEVSSVLSDADADTASNAVQAFNADGFTVGTDADANTANVRFAYIAFSGSDCTSTGTFCVGSYTGNGTTQSPNTGFQPDLVVVKRSGATAGVWKNSSMGANNTNHFAATAQDTAGQMITSLNATSFTVGNATAVNRNTDTYWYFAFKQVSGAMDVGTYTGNGSGSQNIDSSVDAGLTFRPDFVFLKTTALTFPAYGHTNDTYEDYAFSFLDAANGTNFIWKALSGGGFQVGQSSNANTVVHYYAAFGGAPAPPTASGTFTMANGTYTGNATGQSISGLGFSPDLVMIKDGAANYQVFQTKVMNTDSTAYFPAVASGATLITSLDADGFTVGASTVVNTLNNTYQWTAFGNAYNTETLAGGAADFAIGAYTGNGTTSRDILGVPFQPDLVVTKRFAATGAAWRTSALSGDLSSFFAATAESADVIQVLNTNGFQVGANTSANFAGSLYFWFAFKTGPNFTVGTYTGSGGAQNITTVGFQPDLLWVKRSTAVNGVSRPSSLAGDATQYFANLANVATRVITFISNGFSLSGVSTETNVNTATYRYAAWQGKKYTQSAYRWFVNIDSTNVGGVLAAQDTPATVNFTGTTTRLRMLLHVDNGTLFSSGQNFKLQFATSTGACDTGFSGETYEDVTASTLIAYNNNTTPADGATLTANANDPTHGGDTIVPQTYEEANNFTNSVNPVPKGQDGKWDFSLVDNGAPANTTYCFRMVKSDSTLFDTYTVVPQLTTATIPLYAQNYFRAYADNDALLPTDPWPPGAADLGENTSITSADNPIASGENLRLRMSVQVSATGTLALSQAFRLQYGTLVSTCSAIAPGSWADIGAPGSGSVWRGFAATPADGTALSGDPPTGGDLKLSVSDRAGTYEESNDTASNPFRLSVGEDVEYDWNIENNGATGATNYCFRMAKGGGGAALDTYNFYPVVRTAGFRPKSQNWRWYDDETNETPSTALAAENAAPVNIETDNAIKLRMTLKETANVAGVNTKLKLQFSQFSDFSSGVSTVDATSTCTGASSWCYVDGAGVDNVKITTKNLSDADACAASVGNGCGTHNEASSTASTITHVALAATEYEFTIKRSGGSPNTVYYFRAYDTVNDVAVPLNTGESYPSLVTKGGLLAFTIGGLPSGTVTEGITTDITTTATSIPFGTLSFGSQIEGAQRATTTTDASNGYQIFVRQESGFLSNNGAEILGVTGTNATPSAWATGCPGSAAGCYGYHSGDDTLVGGSSRFLTNDTYAKLSTNSEEVVFSSVGVTDEVIDIIFKTQITNQQAAGTYDSTLMYIVVPVF